MRATVSSAAPEAVDTAADTRPTTAGVRAAPPEEDAWFSAPRSRVQALLLFFVLSETASVLRSGARTYFYRTGAVCECPQLVAPGEDGWSGSSFCGDNDAVILWGTRFSANLLFLQLGVDFLFTAVFAALTDKWSSVGVIAIHILVSCLALAGYSATAAQLAAAANAFHTERSTPFWDDGAGWDTELALAANATNCTTDDVQDVLPYTLLLPSTVRSQHAACALEGSLHAHCVQCACTCALICTCIMQKHMRMHMHMQHAHAHAHASQVLVGLAGATLAAPSFALVVRMATPLRKGTAA